MDIEHTCEYRQKADALEARIAVLEAELSKAKKPPKNSGNSGIPPSQDPNRKPYPQREKSTRSTGGQKGHAGHSHPLSENPDEVIGLHPVQCNHCGGLDLEALEQAIEIRQEIDIPPLKEYVREYRQHVSQCRTCGKTSRGVFPQFLQAPVQMSQSIHGLVGYLKVRYHLSHQKISRFCREMLGLQLSEGSVQNSLKRLADTLKPTYHLLK